jgi:hypothetical protein
MAPGHCAPRGAGRACRRTGRVAVVAPWSTTSAGLFTQADPTISLGAISTPPQQLFEDVVLLLRWHRSKLRAADPR